MGDANAAPRPGATYRGRFAPSPTGALHAGSLVAALASWLDAKARDSQWLVRIEDVDTTRCLPGMDQIILKQLAACGLQPDEPPVWQSQRSALYQAALDTLIERQLAYPCACSRQDIARAQTAQGQQRPRHGELIYPGTCRHGLNGRSARAWRLRTAEFEAFEPLAGRYQCLIPSNFIANVVIHWTDRRLGPQRQHVASEVGDFILKRADGCFSYQLAVVVDDAAQGITDVVRGEDLADNTARQILLQQALGLPTPRYLHTPLVLGANGEKLSKQNGAQAIDTSSSQAAREALGEAAQALGLPRADGDTAHALNLWAQAWQVQHQLTKDRPP
jgi:glutamyl-Q tRNA(Asp) synthetase